MREVKRGVLIRVLNAECHDGQCEILVTLHSEDLFPTHAESDESWVALLYTCCSLELRPCSALLVGLGIEEPWILFKLSILEYLRSLIFALDFLFLMFQSRKHTMSELKEALEIFCSKCLNYIEVENNYNILYEFAVYRFTKYSSKVLFFSLRKQRTRNFN